MSSPLRNRWQRTPPVAAALRRVLGVGGDLRRAGLHPRQRAARPGHRDDHAATRRRRSVDGAEVHDRAPGREADAGHAARGAPLRPHPLGREAQQLRVAGHEDEVARRVGSSTAPDHAVAVPQRHDLPLGLVRRIVRRHPLDDALRGAQGQPGASRRRSELSVTTCSPLPEGDELGERRPTATTRVRTDVGGSAGMSRTGRRIMRPRLVTAATSPRAVARHGRRRRRRAPTAGGVRDRQRLVGRRPGEQAGRREQHEARVVGHLERRRLARDSSRAGRLEQHRPARRPERRATSASSSETAPRSRPSSSRSAVSSAIVSSSSDFSLSSSSLLYFVSRRSGISRMYVGLHLAQVEHGHQALARLRRCRRCRG